MDELSEGRGGWIVTPNLDHLRRLVHDADYAELCEGATLRVADGMPLVWASRLQGTPLPERVAGSNLISSVSAAAAAAGHSVYLLGGNEGTAAAAADVLRSRHAELIVAGTCCPPLGFEHDPAAMAAITAELESADPDIVLVGLGSPKQERFIRQLKPHFPRTWWLGIGISFSFVCGDVKRASPLVQRIGLEWISRLAQEPRRLAHRYLIQGLPFAAALMGRAALTRLSSRR
jgi:N-acetylglucosaminyldiphosphoundecaprenol N-acetyl-beta-D-mannosaminyltransferase